jgi:hypothetical protein
MKKRAARQNAFREIMSRLPPESAVTVVGEVSRTWYMDQNRLVEILMALQEASAFVSVIGDGPFRLIAANAIGCCYAADEPVPELCHAEDAEEAHELLVHTNLFLVFPSRVKPDIVSVSPWMSAILNAGVPVIALHPEGDSTYVASE